MPDSTIVLEVPAKLQKQQTRGVLSIYASKLTWAPENSAEAVPFEIQTDTITGMPQTPCVCSFVNAIWSSRLAKGKGEAFPAHCLLDKGDRLRLRR